MLGNQQTRPRFSAGWLFATACAIASATLVLTVVLLRRLGVSVVPSGLAAIIAAFGVSYPTFSRAAVLHDVRLAIWRYALVVLVVSGGFAIVAYWLLQQRT